MAIKGLPGLPRSCTRWKAARGPGAIARPERTAPRRELILAQIQAPRGQGGGRRVQAPFLDLFPSSGAPLDPTAASWQLQPCGCLQLRAGIKSSRAPANPKHLFLRDSELWLPALRELSNQSDRDF